MMKILKNDMRFLKATIILFILCFNSSLLEASDLSKEEVEDDRKVLIVGGNEHHDFDRWFNEEDSKIIEETGAEVSYTDNPEEILPLLPQLDILYLSNNQPLPDPELHSSIHNFVDSGNGLLLVHAATWYIWQDDWPEYYRDFIGGGTQSHPPLGEFDVFVVDKDHPVMQNVPENFTIVDELYRFQGDEEATDIHVLAMGIDPETGTEYPVAWTVDYGEGRVVNITLGHDGDAHQHEAYVTMLQNSIEWLSE